MSAEILRRAASLMRERAKAATPGPWTAYGHSIIQPDELKDGAAPSYASAFFRADVEHIASWHPAVALAVAQVLDAELRRYEADIQWHQDERACGRYPYGSAQISDEAMSLARAYLGESA